MRNVIIEFSLVKESIKVTDFEIINEVSNAFAKEEITIPWCDKVEKISLNKAIFQGTGTINNEGLYTFRVKADDNGTPGVDVDFFDIKIWEGTDTEADPIHKTKNTISGGNIVVHKK